MIKKVGSIKTYLIFLARIFHRRLLCLWFCCHSSLLSANGCWGTGLLCRLLGWSRLMLILNMKLVLTYRNKSMTG